MLYVLSLVVSQQLLVTWGKEMANGTGLRIIGTDTPESIRVSSPNRQAITPNFQVAESIWQRAADTNIKAAQEAERAGQTRLALEQAKMVATQNRQANSGSPIADALNAAAGVIGAVSEARSLRRESQARIAQIEAERDIQLREEQRAQFEQQSGNVSADLFSQLSLELADAESNIDRDVDQRGWITSYQGALDLVRNYSNQLTSEDRQSLNEWLSDQYLGKNEQLQDNLYNQRRESMAQAADYSTHEFEINVLNPLALALGRASSIEEAERYAVDASAAIRSHMSGLMDDRVAPAVAFAQGINLLDSLSSYYRDNTFAIQAMDREREKIYAATESMASLNDQLESNQIGQEEYNAARSLIQFELSGDFTVDSLTSAQGYRDTKERMENIADLEELATQEAMAMSNTQWGNLMFEMHGNGGYAPPALSAEQREEAEHRYRAATQSHATVQELTLETSELKVELDQAQRDHRQAIREMGELSIAIDAFNAGDLQSLLNLGFTSVAEANTSLEEVRTQVSELDATIRSNQEQLGIRYEQINQEQDRLRGMGLPFGLDARRHVNEWLQSDEYKQQEEIAAQQLVEARARDSDFSTGNREARPIPLATVDVVQGSNQVDWTGVTAPFAKGTYVVVSSGQGMRNHPVYGGQRLHPAIDFAVDHGTPILAPRSGVVSRIFWDDNGGGHVVSLTHNDGSESSYLHMAERTHLSLGDVVGQGETIGLVGNTGIGTGAHLDLRVADKPRADGGQWLDVQDWLANSIHETHVLNGYTVPSMGMPPTSQPNYHRQNQSGAPAQVPPEGAFILPSGNYIFEGQLYFDGVSPDRQGISDELWDGQSVPIGGTTTVYNNAVPIEGTLSSPHASDYQVINNDPTANYGYGFFRDNPHAARKLAEVSNNLRIPGQWLADIMFIETGGTFNPAEKEKSGSGAIGLIQFYPGGGLAEVAQAMGVSESEARNRLMRMSFVEQMDYVEQYLSGNYAGDTQYTGKYDRVERLLAAVFIGKPRAFGSQDLSSVMQLADINTSFGHYTTLLGNAVGRRYHTIQDQITGTEVHESFVRGCPTCEAIAESGSPFVAHIRP